MHQGGCRKVRGKVILAEIIHGRAKRPRGWWEPQAIWAGSAMVAIVALLSAAGVTVASSPRPAVTGVQAAGTGAQSAGVTGVTTWHTVRAPAPRHTYHRCPSDVDTPGRHYLPCRAIRLLPWRKLAGGPQRAG